MFYLRGEKCRVCSELFVSFSFETSDTFNWTMDGEIELFIKVFRKVTVGVALQPKETFTF